MVCIGKMYLSYYQLKNKIVDLDGLASFMKNVLAILFFQKYALT